MNDDEDKPLKGMRIAILASDMVEEVELTEPRAALEQAGAETQLISPHDGEILTANHYDKGESYVVDVALDSAEPTDYDALLLPGGALNADFMRAELKVQQFIQEFDTAGKPMAFICHAPWMLISAGVVDGRTLTGYRTIQDDVMNAGGDWVDKAVVVDENWVSSRQPDDIPLFNDAMVKLFTAAFEAGGEPE